ncbi:hypothetical protein TrCOL_g147, partial [Triparma columacea]
NVQEHIDEAARRGTRTHAIVENIVTSAFMCSKCDKFRRSSPSSIGDKILPRDAPDDWECSKMGVGIDCDTDEVDWGVDQPPLGKDVSAEDKEEIDQFRAFRKEHKNLQILESEMRVAWIVSGTVVTAGSLDLLVKRTMAKILGGGVKVKTDEKAHMDAVGEIKELVRKATATKYPFNICLKNAIDLAGNYNQLLQPEHKLSSTSLKKIADTCKNNETRRAAMNELRILVGEKQIGETSNQITETNCLNFLNLGGTPVEKKRDFKRKACKKKGKLRKQVREKPSETVKERLFEDGRYGPDGPGFNESFPNTELGEDVILPQDLSKHYPAGVTNEVEDGIEEAGDKEDTKVGRKKDSFVEQVLKKWVEKQGGEHGNGMSRKVFKLALNKERIPSDDIRAVLEKVPLAMTSIAREGTKYLEHCVLKGLVKPIEKFLMNTETVGGETLELLDISELGFKPKAKTLQSIIDSHIASLNPASTTYKKASKNPDSPLNEYFAQTNFDMKVYEASLEGTPPCSTGLQQMRRQYEVAVKLHLFGGKSTGYASGGIWRRLISFAKLLLHIEVRSNKDDFSVGDSLLKKIDPDYDDETGDETDDETVDETVDETAKRNKDVYHLALAFFDVYTNLGESQKRFGRKPDLDLKELRGELKTIFPQTSRTFECLLFDVEDLKNLITSEETKDDMGIIKWLQDNLYFCFLIDARISAWIEENQERAEKKSLEKVLEKRNKDKSPGDKRFEFEENYDGLDYDGLDYDGLDYDGLDYDGLDSAGLDSAGLDYAGLDYAGLDYDGLDYDGLGTDGRRDSDNLDYNAPI